MLGLPTEDSSELVIVYPNPMTNVLYIKNSTGFDIDEMAVIDSTGKKIMRSFDNTTCYDIQKVPTGIYLLKLKIGDKVYTKKFIKK